MNTSRDRTEDDMPDTIIFAVLTVDGELHFERTPSNPEFKKDSDGCVTLYHHGPWGAITETIGGPCRRLDRAQIGNGLMAWASDESLLRPDAYPPNEIGGRTVNILKRVAQGIDTGPEENLWGGTIVITSAEDHAHDRWCGFIWPLDDEDQWLIREAWRAASGDDMSELFTDDLDIDDAEATGPTLCWERATKCKAVYMAVGSTGDIWYVINRSYEQGGDMGRWTLARESRRGRLTVESEFDTMQEAIHAGEAMAAEEVG